MATDILMPALSPTMEEGKLAKWLVKEGDTVKSGDILAEIETDKATMEFEAVDEGRIGKLLVAEGTEGVKVNQPIATLLEEGASQERSLRSGTAQIGNLAVALAQGMYLGLRYTDGDGAKAAAANALGSWIVGEAEILTAPQALTRLQNQLLAEGRTCVAQAQQQPALADRRKAEVEILVGAGFAGARVRF